MKRSPYGGISRCGSQQAAIHRPGKTLHVDAANGVLGNDSDADSLQLAVILKDGTAHGELALNPDGSFDYLADQGFVGVDSFSYVANDGADDSTIATVSIEIKAILYWMFQARRGRETS